MEPSDRETLARIDENVSLLRSDFKEHRDKYHDFKNDMTKEVTTLKHRTKVWGLFTSVCLAILGYLKSTK